MALSNHIFLGILILQIYVHAAPSDVGKLEDIATTEKADETIDSTPKEIEDNGQSTDSPRQKRYYNPYGYGFPPISKLIYPSSFSSRDNFDSVGAFGVEDPLLQIHKRVQEIASFVRQPPPPPIPQVPIFFPVLFVPPFDCGCNPTDPSPTEPSTTDNNTQAPNVTNRFPEMEDERQNWGIVTDDRNGDDDQDDQDFSRPISFDPIKFDRPNARPPPPVEHGTFQSDAGNSQNPESSESSSPAPAPSSTRPPAPPSATQDPFFNAPQRPPQRRPPPTLSPDGLPTPCDGAILTCCHQPQVAYDCFAIQGCPNFTPYGNPCETNSILRIIEKFQRFYGNRNG